VVKGVGNLKAFTEATAPRCVAAARQMEALVLQWAVSFPARSVDCGTGQSVATTAGGSCRPSLLTYTVTHRGFGLSDGTGCPPLTGHVQRGENRRGVKDSIFRI